MRQPFDPHGAETRRAKLMFDANALITKAQHDNRTDFDETEKTAYAAIEKELGDLHKQASAYAADRSFDGLRTGDPDQLAALGFPRAGSHVMVRSALVTKSLGQQFVDKQTGIGEWLEKTRGNRPRSFTAPVVELKLAATVTSEDTGVPHYVPGLVPSATRPPTVMELIPQTPIAQNSVITMVETTATNAADAVAEGAVKPESVLDFTKATDPTRKIATWVPVSDEALDDVPQLQGYIDGRLRMFVDQKTDDEIIAGTGVDPHLLGILNRPGLTAPYAQAAGENAADAIAKQWGIIASTQFLLPDAVVLNATDWVKFLLMKTTTGEYLGGNPFAPFPAPMLWGMRVAVSPMIAVGTALVGAFGTAAMLFPHGGLKVEFGNQHADFFVRNLTAVLAERRIALSVIRPGAFGKVSALDFTPLPVGGTRESREHSGAPRSANP